MAELRTAPLFDVTTHLDDVNPNAVTVRQVTIATALELQPLISTATWRPAPGRKLAFLVEHDGDLLGMIVLSSPVINLGPRDEYLNLPSDPSVRGRALREIADMSACVATQPFGWYWNGGKLIASLAPTLGDYWRDAYGDELRGIVTTSIKGRGSQYNRLYRFLGYTSGYGHEHVTDDEYRAMLSWMRVNGVDIPGSRFGDGSNPRMRRIAAYHRARGERVELRHGVRRGIYWHESDDRTPQQVAAWWRDRWGLSRWERKRWEHPPYLTGGRL